MLKVWDVQGNALHKARDFYPLLLEVGKDVAEGAASVVALPCFAVHKSSHTSCHSGLLVPLLIL
jgi:hypothetical protein